MRSQLHRWHVVVGLAMLVACGARVTNNTASDGGADVASDAIHQVDTSTDAADASVDVNPDGDAADTPPTPVCEAGVYYVTVVDDAGSHVFNGACDDASVPDALDVGCGMKIICGYVSACSTTGSIAVETLQPPYPASLKASIKYVADVDASLYAGTVTLAAWPQPGGTVSGSFSGSTVDGGASVTGSFCVRRR